jgi:hypothetical protein
MHKCTEETFLTDVSKHEITILKDDGIYRHLRFRTPTTNHQYFEIITWPGYLTFTGDMGCFVFARLKDMFEFFRHNSIEIEKLYINKGYWAEKLEAISRFGCDGHIKKFSMDLLKEKVEQIVQSWIEEDKLSKQNIKLLREEIKYMYQGLDDSDEFGARKAVYNFSYKLSHLLYEFENFWERDCSEYTYHYIWCCYAIAWAIKQYDLFKDI